MDFSESYRCSLLPAFSPDGRHVAAAVEYRLVIREVETLKVAQIYSCLDKIHRVEWSPSGKYVLCAMHSRGAVQVWSLDDPEWSCKVDEGPAGVKAARWSPDGASLLLVADFCVRMTAWSLVDRRCSYLPGPKHAGKGLAFSPGGDQLAVIERKDAKDWLALYSCSPGWDLERRVQLPTLDAADLSWSPAGDRLVVWDSALAYRVAVFGAGGGALGEYSAYADALGVRCVSWSPGGDLLAVGSYDQVVRVLNGLTWAPLLECHHGSPVDEPPGAAVYQEVEEPRSVLAPMQVQQQHHHHLHHQAAAAKREGRARYLVRPLPVEITSVPPAANKPNPKLGISQVAWSPDSQLLATVNDNMPGAVWVWDVAAASLCSVLLQLEPVRCVGWSPAAGAGPCLAVGCGGGRVYLWTPGGASIVHVPLGGFGVCALAWAPGGSSLVLMDREAFCCAYVTPTA